MRVGEDAGLREEVQDLRGSPHWGQLVSVVTHLSRWRFSAVREGGLRSEAKKLVTVVVVIAAVVLLGLMVACGCM